jgi:hypothetical protein
MKVRKKLTFMYGHKLVYMYNCLRKAASRDQEIYLSSVVEKKASGAISVLSISWVETLLTYQGSLLVTNTLGGGGGED